MPLRALIGVLAALLAGCDAPAVEGETDDEAEGVDPQALFGLACGTCHGADGRGTTDGPDLAFRVGDLTTDEVVAIVQLGAGAMDPVPLPVEDAEVVAAWVVEQFGTP